MLYYSFTSDKTNYGGLCLNVLCAIDQPYISRATLHWTRGILKNIGSLCIAYGTHQAFNTKVEDMSELEGILLGAYQCEFSTQLLALLLLSFHKNAMAHCLAVGMKASLVRAAFPWTVPQNTKILSIICWWSPQKNEFGGFANWWLPEPNLAVAETKFGTHRNRARWPPMLPVYQQLQLYTTGMLNIHPYCCM